MSTAAFIKSDTTTQGTWYSGTATGYGKDGYAVIGQGAGAIGAIATTVGDFSYPAYATVTVGSGTLAWCYQTSTSDVRAVEYAPPGTSNGSDTKRVAAVWFTPGSGSGTTFTLDIQDGATHQIAMYFVDWDNSGRNQTITITDDLNGNALLDTRTISGFNNGLWLIWNISGKVTFTFTNNVGTANAVVNGIFFDTPIGTIFPPLVSRPRFEPAHYE